MSKAVKKAISLPADLAAEAEAIARDENKSLSAVVQDALRALIDMIRATGGSNSAERLGENPFSEG